MTSMNESTTDGNTKGTAMTATLTWARDAETGEYSTLTRDHRGRKIELKIAKDPENSKSWMISKRKKTKGKKGRGKVKAFKALPITFKTLASAKAHSEEMLVKTKASGSGSGEDEVRDSEVRVSS